jgi:hypothetical protein
MTTVPDIIQSKTSILDQVERLFSSSTDDFFEGFFLNVTHGTEITLSLEDIVLKDALLHIVVCIDPEREVL